MRPLPADETYPARWRGPEDLLPHGTPVIAWRGRWQSWWFRPDLSADAYLCREEDLELVEIYTDEREAEFLLSNAVDKDDYERAAASVREMGLDPEQDVGPLPGDATGMRLNLYRKRRV